MKVTDFKMNANYKRKADGKVFKIEGTSYFVVNDNNRWEPTEDIRISDEFEVTHENPVDYTLTELYNLYKTSDISKRDRFLDRFMLEVARQLDGKTNEK